MNAAPQISCILPAYNAEHYLRDTLESIFAQQGVTFEVIVIDDGSTDRTATIAESYGDRLRLLHQPNLGPAAARNLGIGHARGALLTFMDADDLYPTDMRFAAQVLTFEQEPELELCAGHVQNFTGDLEFVGDPLPGYNCDVMVRPSVFQKAGLFPDGFRHAARLEWMLRVRKAGVHERLMPDTLIYRRLHGENMSLTDSNQSLREHLRVLHASLKNRA